MQFMSQNWFLGCPRESASALQMSKGQDLPADCIEI